MPNPPNHRRRIEPLDIYRCLFVVLAAFSHILGHLDGWAIMEENSMLVFGLLTRGATPGLLILFGVMMELVYVSYAQRDGLVFTYNRLVYRCLLCYCAFVTVAIAGFASGNTGLPSLVGALSLLGTSTYANIFKIYLFLILAMLPILALRIKAGTLPLLGVVVLIWVIDFLLIEPLDNPLVGHNYPIRYLEHSLDFFFGVGESWGPSIFHSIALVIFGMVMANAIISRSKAPTLAFVLLAGLSLALTVLEVRELGFKMYMANIRDISVYRQTNHYLYYAFGVVYSVVALAVAWVLFGILPTLVRRGFTYIGSRTFEFFMLINVLIVATPNSLQVKTVWMTWLALGIYSLFTCLIMFIWENRLEALPIVSRGRDKAKHISQQLVRLVTRQALTS